MTPPDGGHNPGTASAVGLFAGVGGFERGLEAAGLGTALLCEIEEHAHRVLASAFPRATHVRDIRSIKALPKVDIVTAGFPCQDLSLVGSNRGIFGDQSGLIHEVFRLISGPRTSPDWLVLENVPFMLRHRQGHAIRYVLTCLEELGFQWAYRVVNTQHFGLPQRRRRVLIVASRKHDPRTVLFADNHVPREAVDDGCVPCGFYWTEGRGGLGWAINGVPTLKGGSALGIPSPPAIWDRASDEIVTPDIRDAERLQGFPVNWTLKGAEGSKVKLGQRWKMIGNAVSVPVAKWLGSRLINPGDEGRRVESARWDGGVWPSAACSSEQGIRRIFVSEAPVRVRPRGLDGFLKYPTVPLSARATNGFVSRARTGSLRFAPGFLDACDRHYKRALKR